MTKIDIISGFLGAGKTTFIKKLLQEAIKGEQVVLIENEFGQIGIDGGFLKDSGIEIREMNSGCICCSLVPERVVAAFYHGLRDFSQNRQASENQFCNGVCRVIDYMRSADFNPSAEVTVDELKKELAEKPRQVSLKELNNISQY